MSTRYSWMRKQLKQQPIRALAGYPLELDAKEYFQELLNEQEVTWTIARRIYSGQVLRWIPRSPGVYSITLRASGTGSRTITAQVGLRQQDLVDRKDTLDYFFCLVAPSGMKIHFIPLLNREGEGDTSSREKLKREVEQRNPAFAQLMRVHTQIYRQKVSRLIPQLWHAAKKVEPGLYAVFSGSVVHLGSATPVQKAVEVVRTMLEEQANITAGRGSLLIETEKVVNELKPLEYRYSEKAEFPPLTRPGFGAFAVENFGRGALNNIVASLLQFGNTIGVNVGLGGATSVITYNAASGLLNTRIFDSALGLSRQISSGFDIFGKIGSNGLAGKTGLLGIDSFGRGTREGCVAKTHGGKRWA